MRKDENQGMRSLAVDKDWDFSQRGAGEEVKI
jgi:hypothetical protein